MPAKKKKHSPIARAKPKPKAALASAKKAEPEDERPPVKEISKELPAANAPPKRMPVDDALRAAGLGELRFAQTLGLFFERILKKPGQEKLMLDGLKEWGRQFERSRPTERAGDSPVFVQMIHNVPRPERLPRPPPFVARAVLSDATPSRELAAAPAGEAFPLDVTLL
jgi:hypothetical protein